ncbi:MAG: leucine-rich repeat protein [Lachnospiraceae bacterium]|nr:leucine-rich repeat protein [Lachnospiraceae bacterium]
MKALKKMMFGFACVCLLAFGISGRAEAKSGTCGDNLTWNLDETTHKLTISGTGKMTDYSATGKGQAPWINKNKTINVDGNKVSVDMFIASVEVGKGVTHIGSYAFDKCVALGSVSLPDGLVSIGDSAFSNCARLGSIKLPDSVVSIGSSSFKSCQSLADLTISKSLTSIGNKAFSGCVSLGNVTFPAGLGYIGSSAFEGCSSLKAAVITGPLANLGGSAFKDCTGLTGMMLPSSIRYLNMSTFEGCTGLKSVKFVGNYLWNIGAKAFYGCTALSDIELPGSLKDIDAGAFVGCASLKEITIPGSVKTIKAKTFVQCGLRTMTLGEGVKTIESGAVVGCPGLGTVIIPKSVKTMRAGAFTQCGLSKVKYVGKKTDWKKIKGYEQAFVGVNPKIEYNIPSRVKSIKLSDKSVKLAKKESVQLILKVSPVYSPKEVTWSTSDFKKVNVNTNGYVTAYKPGKVTITAKCGGKKATCKVTVYAPVEKVKFTKESVSVRVGRKVTLSTKITPKDATEKKLTFTSDKPEVATVSSKGVVKGVSKGTATITVTAPSGKKATCEVKVS